MKGVYIMKKSMFSGIAVVAALTLALSCAPVFAAPSVSGNSAAVSGNSASASEERVLTDEEREEIRVYNIIQEFVSKASSYILGRPGTAVAKAQSGYVTVKTASERYPLLLIIPKSQTRMSWYLFPLRKGIRLVRC